jgi:hypothetical protein
MSNHCWSCKHYADGDKPSAFCALANNLVTGNMLGCTEHKLKIVSPKIMLYVIKFVIGSANKGAFVHYLSNIHGHDVSRMTQHNYPTDIFSVSLKEQAVKFDSLCRTKDIAKTLQIHFQETEKRGHRITDGHWFIKADKYKEV